MVTSIGATAKRSKLLKKAASCRSLSPPVDFPGARSVALPVLPIDHHGIFVPGSALQQPPADADLLFSQVAATQRRRHKRPGEALAVGEERSHSRCPSWFDDEPHLLEEKAHRHSLDDDP